MDVFATELGKTRKQPLDEVWGLFLEREKRSLFKLKEHLPFCLRVSADIWNSPGKQNKTKRCGESILKTISTFCSLLNVSTLSGVSQLL